MDYQAFYTDVVDWIGQANQMAIKHGMGHENFWLWVADSSARLSEKYGNPQLAINQMVMLIDWLEGVYKSSKQEMTS